MKGLDCVVISLHICSSSNKFDDYISNLDLNQISMKLSKKIGWTQVSAERACFLYKRFLFLQKKYGEKYILSPSEDIDEVWHMHILDTKKYQEDCEFIFGKILHHVPTYGNKESNFKAFELTQDLYHKEYNDYIYEANLKIFRRTIEFCLIPFKFFFNRLKPKFLVFN
jgi:hypothetical protein